MATKHLVIHCLGSMATMMPVWPPWYIHGHHAPNHHDGFMATTICP